jgi:hypothetical protein
MVGSAIHSRNRRHVRLGWYPQARARDGAQARALPGTARTQTRAWDGALRPNLQSCEVEVLVESPLGLVQCPH